MSCEWRVTDDRAAVSPLAVVLVVALLLGGALLAGATLEQAGRHLDGAAAPTVVFTFERTGDGSTLLVSHTGGDRVDGAHLYVVRTDREAPVGTWASDACTTPVDQVAAGDFCLVPDAGLSPAVLLVWRATPEGPDHVLARWTNPGRLAVPRDPSTSSPPSPSTTSPSAPGTTTPSQSGGSGAAGRDGTGAVSDADATVGRGWSAARFDGAAVWTATGAHRSPSGDELALNTSAGAGPAATAFADHDWRNGATESFALRFDPTTGLASFVVGNDTVTQAVDLPPAGDVAVTVYARDADGDSAPDGRVAVTAVALDGRARDETAVATNAAAPVRHLVLADADTADGFALTGSVQVSWTGARPADGALGFVIQVEG